MKGGAVAQFYTNADKLPYANRQNSSESIKKSVSKSGLIPSLLYDFSLPMLFLLYIIHQLQQLSAAEVM